MATGVPARPRDRLSWRNVGAVHSLTAWLALFFAVNFVVFNVALVVLPTTGPKQLGVYETYRFLTFSTSADSWEPMQEAWRYLDGGGDHVYDEIFFERDIKFQYAPTSLLPAEIMQRVLGGDHLRFKALDAISWASVVATAGITAAVFDRAVRRYAPGMAPATRQERWVRAALIAALTLTFYPVARAFGLGQIQTWINGLFALMVLLWMMDRRAGAGVAAGLIVMIKPQLALLLVWGLLRRHWSFSASLAGTFGASGLAAISLYGISNHTNYLDVLSYISRRGEAFYPNQSVNGLLNRLLETGPNAAFEVRAFPPFDPAVYAGTIVTSVLLVVVALFWRSRDAAHDTTLDLCLASLTFTIASPIAWEHHYGVMAPMFAIAFAAMLRWPVFGPWSLAYLAMAYVLCANFLQFTVRFAETPLLTPLQSYLLAGALMTLVALYRLRAAATAGAPAPAAATPAMDPAPGAPPAR